MAPNCSADVQAVIGAWVARFREHPPNEQDVRFFARFLVQCADHARSTDAGVQRAVAVMKWWLVLLRRDFGEDFVSWDGDQRGTSESAHHTTLENMWREPKRRRTLARNPEGMSDPTSP